MEEIDRDPACDQLGLDDNGGASMNAGGIPVVPGHDQPLKRATVECPQKTKLVPMDAPLPYWEQQGLEVYGTTGQDGTPGLPLSPEDLDKMRSVQWLTDDPTYSTQWLVVPMYLFECVVNTSPYSCTGTYSSGLELSTFQGTAYDIGGSLGGSISKVGPVKADVSFEQGHQEKNSQKVNFTTGFPLELTQDKSKVFAAVLVRKTTIYHNGTVIACYGVRNDCIRGTLQATEKVSFWMSPSTGVWQSLVDTWQEKIQAWGELAWPYDHDEPNLAAQTFVQDETFIGGQLSPGVKVTWSKAHATLTSDDYSVGANLQLWVLDANGKSSGSSGQEKSEATNAELTYNVDKGLPSKCMRLYKVVETVEYPVAGFSLKEGCK